MGEARQWDIDPDARKLIRHKVNQMIGKNGFTRSDREDLEQELAMYVARRDECYDGRRGASRRTFFECIITRKVITILHANRAKKRDWRRQQTDPELDERPSMESAESQALLELRIDVRQTVQSLPLELQSVATLFMKYSEAEIIERTGMTRAQVRHRRALIARHFQSCGLAPADDDNNQRADVSGQ